MNKQASWSPEDDKVFLSESLKTRVSLPRYEEIDDIVLSVNFENFAVNGPLTSFYRDQKSISLKFEVSTADIEKIIMGSTSVISISAKNQEREIFKYGLAPEDLKSVSIAKSENLTWEAKLLLSSLTSADVKDN